MTTNELKKRYEAVITAVNILVSLCTTTITKIPDAIVALYIDSLLDLRNFNENDTFQENVLNDLGLSVNAHYGYLLVYMDDAHIRMLLYSVYSFVTLELHAVYFECNFVTGDYKYELMEHDYGKWYTSKRCYGANGFKLVFETMWELFYKRDCSDVKRQKILEALGALQLSWIH